MTWLRILWAAQYPLWWVAPNSRAFHAIRVHYARKVNAWLETRKEAA